MGLFSELFGNARRKQDRQLAQRGDAARANLVLGLIQAEIDRWANQFMVLGHASRDPRYTEQMLRIALDQTQEMLTHQYLRHECRNPEVAGVFCELMPRAQAAVIGYLAQTDATYRHDPLGALFRMASHGQLEQVSSWCSRFGEEIRAGRVQL